MMPWQRAKKWQLENTNIPFEEVLGRYILDGVVFSSEDVFMLARKVKWQDGQMTCGNVKANTWFCQLAAGDMRKFLKVAPKKLRYVAWQRHGEKCYRVWPWRKFQRIVNRRK